MCFLLRAKSRNIFRESFIRPDEWIAREYWNIVSDRSFERGRWSFAWVVFTTNVLRTQTQNRSHLFSRNQPQHEMIFHWKSHAITMMTIRAERREREWMLQENSTQTHRGVAQRGHLGRLGVDCSMRLLLFTPRTGAGKRSTVWMKSPTKTNCQSAIFELTTYKQSLERCRFTQIRPFNSVLLLLSSSAAYFVCELFSCERHFERCEC